MTEQPRPEKVDYMARAVRELFGRRPYTRLTRAECAQVRKRAVFLMERDQRLGRFYNPHAADHRARARGNAKTRELRNAPPSDEEAA